MAPPDRVADLTTAGVEGSNGVAQTLTVAALVASGHRIYIAFALTHSQLMSPYGDRVKTTVE